MADAGEMMSAPTAEDRDAGAVEVRAENLPVHCPNPAMPLWSSHPRVFLDVAKNGRAMCPYCGTRYRLIGVARHAGH